MNIVELKQLLKLKIDNGTLDGYTKTNINRMKKQQLLDEFPEHNDGQKMKFRKKLKMSGKLLVGDKNLFHQNKHLIVWGPKKLLRMHAKCNKEQIHDLVLNVVGQEVGHNIVIVNKKEMFVYAHTPTGLLHVVQNGSIYPMDLSLVYSFEGTGEYDLVVHTDNNPGGQITTIHVSIV
jgi:hypothetical protein